MSSRSKRRRRVLGASCILAALIIAGSSFAWFTSKDEVTNRLTATSNYGVSIAENFTPPKNWVPGQVVDKDVAVVNTGNVDAFVRTWLEGEMNLVTQTTSALATTAFPANPTAVTDQKLIDLGLTYSNGTGDALVYLKELDNTKLIANPDTQNPANQTVYTEVMAVQSGGELAYTSGTQYKFTPNQSMSVTNSAGAIQAIAKNVEYTVTIDPAATDDITVTTNGAVGTITLNDIAAFRTIDSDTFEPVSDGLYIFKRNVDLGAATEFEFSGYYVKTIDGDKHFFALEYATTGTRSDCVLANNAITYAVANDGSYTVDVTNVKLFTAKQETVENSGLTWELVRSATFGTPQKTYTSTDGTTWYDGTTALDPNNNEHAAILADIANAEKRYSFKVTKTGSNIVINIALTNIGVGSENWTAKTAANKTTTFYYNNDVEEGATTAQLVDNVGLDSTVTKNDYIAFDFDLNVKLESIQVTVDDNGNESVLTVAPWNAGDNTYVTAHAEATDTANGEIVTITWNDAN